MTSRNIAIVFILVSAIAVAYLLGRNEALNESLTEDQNQATAQPSAFSESNSNGVSEASRKAAVTPTPSKEHRAPLTTVTPKPTKSESSFEAKPPAPAIAERPCVIIGNKNSGIYHVPGCKSYDKVAPHNREYFCTEEAAQKAGFRKARNC